MKNRNDRFIDTILFTLVSSFARQHGVSQEEMKARCGTDEIAPQMKKYLAKCPKNFDFELTVASYLPYHDEAVDIHFSESNGRLRISTSLSFARDSVPGRAEAVARFMKHHELSQVMTMRDAGRALILSLECEFDDLLEIESRFSCWLEILFVDEDFADVVTEILEM